MGPKGVGHSFGILLLFLPSSSFQPGDAHSTPRECPVPNQACHVRTRHPLAQAEGAPSPTRDPRVNQETPPLKPGTLSLNSRPGNALSKTRHPICHIPARKCPLQNQAPPCPTSSSCDGSAIRHDTVYPARSTAKCIMMEHVPGRRRAPTRGHGAALGFTSEANPGVGAVPAGSEGRQRTADSGVS